jgi:hypothetical protein
MLHCCTSDLNRRSNEHREELIKAIVLRYDASRARLSRLVDVYADGMIDKSLFEEKKLNLLMEQKSLEEQKNEIARSSSHVNQKLDAILERIKSLPQAYEIGNPHERRCLLIEITSNMTADRKDIAISLKSPFREIGIATSVSSSALVRDTPRTRAIADILVQYCSAPEMPA